jgi:hypothetical protein
MSEPTPPSDQPAQPPVDPTPPTPPAPTPPAPTAPAPTQPVAPAPAQPAVAATPAPQAAPAQPAYAPAAPTPQPGYGYPQGGAPTGPVPPGQTPGGNFKSSRGKTIGLIVAGVLAVGAIGGIAAAVLGGDDAEAFSSSTSTEGAGTTEPDDVTPSDGGGILDPTPIGSATPEPDATSSAEPSDEPTTEPTEAPTEGPSPTLGPEPSADVVTIGNGVQVAVLPGWEVVGQGDSDVLLADGQNSYVYALTGTVNPAADAASVIAGSMDSVLPPQSYTQLRTTDIAPLQAFGSVVSIAAMQYQATWVDQQASVPLQGLLICAIRQDGTALIITAEHAPPDEFKKSSDSWAPVVNATLGLFGAS